MKNTVFDNSKWIWAKNSIDVDDYAEFVFDVKTSCKNLILRISSDSTYAVYINDKLEYFLECSDFPNDKYYDEFVIYNNNDIVSFKIDVWHYGVGSQKYIASNHGLIFEICDDKKVLCSSNESIKSRVINEFKNGLENLINGQQGFTFEYDFNVNKSNLDNSIVIDKERKFSKRSINRIVLGERINPIYTKIDENNTQIDMTREVSGFADIDINSEVNQKVVISYAERLDDGRVLSAIADRNFTFVYNLKKGRNVLLNPLKRFGGRFLEIHSEYPINIGYIGLRPVNYSHKLIEKKFSDQLVNDIYKICIHTLECCMHEHYEDCPWREQCLYSLDSRNQMLCGYYAFEGFEYQRHNLVLLSKSLNSDGVLSICSPTENKHSIPSFSLYFFQSVAEYIEYSKDKSIIPEVEETLNTLLNTFSSRIEENGLIKHLGKLYWNFYEWAESSSYDEELVSHYEGKDNQYDLILNCLYVLAVQYYNEIFNTDIDVSKTKKSIVDMFYSKEKNVFLLNNKSDKYSQFGNSLACLIGLGNESIIENILSDKNMIKSTLSTRGYLYDAMLKYDDKNNFIINDIKQIYKKMIDYGSTTVWETELGPKDFGGAGSMCHGWSALPIYYFNLLIKD